MNKTYLWLLLVLFIVSSTGYAQQIRVVKGSLVDTAGVPLIGAVIKLSTATDSIKAASDVNGGYVFNNVKFSQFELTASYIGYQPVTRKINLAPTDKIFVVDTIRLRTASNSLNEIAITSVTPVRVKEDTVEYSAAAYPVRDGDAVEEVIKKLPGVTVDKDGNVVANGKPITKIRVNGKDFFGTDVATAIQNLPADIVKNLQLIDDYGDQAKLTGVKVGEPQKILNINIQEDKKKGYFGRGTGGIGNEDRFIANVKGSTFKGDRMLSMDGSMNNTNIRGGGGDGITETKALALSYSNDFNKKLSLDAGYNFNSRNNNTISSVFRQSTYSDFVRIDDQRSNNSNDNSNHSFWSNLEFKPDTVNYFKLSPNISFNSTGSYGKGNTVTSANKVGSVRDNNSSTETSTSSIGMNVFYNRKFQKRGRNFNVSANVNFSDNDNDRDARNNYANTDTLGNVTYENQFQLTGYNTHNIRTGANATLTEPLGKYSFADISYNYNSQDTRTGRDVRDVDPVTGNEIFNNTLSNSYQYQFITNRAGINYRFVKPKFNYMLGINVQPALLKGQDLTRDIDTRKETLNWIPSARFVYRFSKQQSLTFNYNGRSNQPSFNQLQPITDNSNIQNTVSGNPNLKPDYTHGFNLDYNQSDWGAGYNMFSNASYTRVQNKIVSTRIAVPGSIKQTTSYINTNGFYSVRGNYEILKPFAERKYILSWYGGANYNNNVGFADQQRNIAKNLVLDQGLKFRVFLKDIVDAELNTSYSNNSTNYSLASFADRKTNRYQLTVSGRNYFFKNLSLGYDLSQVINKGYNASANANPTLLNVFLEQRFLKGGTGNLRFQAFDLMNQNTGISRDVFDNEIVDRQANRLARYFLLSFSMRVRKFGGKQ